MLHSPANYRMWAPFLLKSYLCADAIPNLFCILRICICRYLMTSRGIVPNRQLCTDLTMTPILLYQDWAMSPWLFWNLAVGMQPWKKMTLWLHNMRWESLMCAQPCDNSKTEENKQPCPNQRSCHIILLKMACNLDWQYALKKSA